MKPLPSETRNRCAVTPRAGHYKVTQTVSDGDGTDVPEVTGAKGGVIRDEKELGKTHNLPGRTSHGLLSMPTVNSPEAGLSTPSLAFKS